MSEISTSTKVRSLRFEYSEAERIDGEPVGIIASRYGSMSSDASPQDDDRGEMLETSSLPSTKRKPLRDND
jgi:hypothetical protein